MKAEGVAPVTVMESPVVNPCPTEFAVAVVEVAFANTEVPVLGPGAVVIGKVNVLASTTVMV